MEFFSEDSARARKKLILAIKISVARFALIAVALSVFLIIDITNGAGWNNEDNGGDADKSSDMDAPVIVGPEGNVLYVSIGETIAYRNAVKVTDDSKYTLDVTNNTVNTEVAGTYSVTYVAKDAYGNTSKLTLKVVVTKGDYTYEMLKSVVEKLAPRLNISNNMSTAEKVRKIYEFVNDPSKSASEAKIRFDDKSNIPNIDRNAWKTDWIEEAYRTLKPIADGATRTDHGDCYSYYSASKAFFTYYGIEHEGIKRDDSGTNMAGTHFWLVVNVGTASNKVWYYYDATRLAGKFADGSNQCCLRTLEELTSYKPSKVEQYGFYSFDPTNYPTVSTKKTDFN